MPRGKRDDPNKRISNFEKKHGIPPGATRGKKEIAKTTSEETPKQLMDCFLDVEDRAELYRQISHYCTPSLAEKTVNEVARRQLQSPKLAAYIEAREKIQQDTKDCLDTAREAITDAIFLDNGLDSGAGKKVIDWINAILGDEDEWIKNHQFIVD